VKAGDAIPPLERTISLHDMVAYGAATWDWHPMHYDRDWADAAGLPGPVVDGQMFGGLLAEQIVDWLGPRAFVTHLKFRFKSMMFAGETALCEGEVLEVTGGAVSMSQRITVSGRLVVEGTARARL
jgi:acyl dehydratase